MSRLLNHHQLINVAGLVPGRQSNGHRHHQRNESEKSPRSVKMTCVTTTTTFRASGLRMSSFSRTNKIMVRTLQDFYPKVARSRCVVKAMFERFNEKAIRAIMIAQDESRRLGHCYVGTEQILLGLIGEGTGIAARVLRFMGINYEDTRLQVEKIIGRGSGFVALDIPFTPPVKRVLELSGEESHQLGHYHIGTEHLLLGLLREGEGVATHVLKNMGVDATKIRRQVICMAFMGPRSNINKMPTLEEYFTNLTKLAEEGKLDPVVGRQQEIERVIQILLRHTKNNPALIGEPGVGKTAIVEGLAQWIANGDVPETLQGKKVVTLDMGLVVAGTKYQGEFKERLKKLVEEIKQRDDIIVFIDEAHNSIGDGLVYKGEIDAGNILKPALARGELQCIVATTVDKYNKHIEKNPALKRRFQIVEVLEPTVDETIKILKGLKERYEIHHNLRYTDEALVAAANLSYQYISDRFLPDKAIDLIDEAGSWVRLRHAKGPAELPEEVGEEEKEVRQIVKEKEEAVRNQDYEKAIELRQEEMVVKVYISELIKKGKEMSKAENEAGDHGGLVVAKADIQNVVSSSTGIPVEKLSTGD